MKIRMLQTEKGSVDGVTVRLYCDGQEYDLTNSDGERSLAAAFVGARMAVEVREIIGDGEPLQAMPEEADSPDAKPKRPYNRKPKS